MWMEVHRTLQINDIVKSKSGLTWVIQKIYSKYNSTEYLISDWTNAGWFFQYDLALMNNKWKEDYQHTVDGSLAEALEEYKKKM
jgi:hypothetical protein